MNSVDRAWLRGWQAANTYFGAVKVGTIPLNDQAGPYESEVLNDYWGSGVRDFYKNRVAVLNRVLEKRP